MVRSFRISLIFLCVIFISTAACAQKSELFTVSKDSSTFALTLAGAEYLSALPLKCISQQFPNKTSHTSFDSTDHILLPQELHPAFYGCFDWHSSVHGHWMLIKLLKEFPNMPNAAKIRAALNTTLTREHLLKEAAYFDMPLASSWERTYGWAWMLKLGAELKGWNDPDGKKWSENIAPLVQKILVTWKKFLPKQTYPNRTGVHPNTAFGLTLAYDYAVAANDTSFKNAVVKAGIDLFFRDTDAPVKWEPNGSDFFSPTLEEADLMRRILSKNEFLKWLGKFITTDDIKRLSVLPVVSDRTDLQIVHLDGLCFSRAWCMLGIAKQLPAGDKRKNMLIAAAALHLKSALPNVVSGEYGGEHWLASFAVYALLNKQ
jgi:hypothetical protein